MHELETLYTPRTMLEALEQKPAPSTFLRDMFVRGKETHDTDTIEIDIEKGGQTLAAYVARGGDANRVALGGYSTGIHVIPYVAEEIRFTPKDLKVRDAGETIYNGKGPKARLDKKMGKGLRELRQRFSNLGEFQLSKALQTGKVVVTGKGVNYTVDFRMDPDHIIVNTAPESWDDANVDKEKQLREMSLLPQQKGAPTPNKLIMGYNAATLFGNDEKLIAKLDIKNYNTGHIDFMQLANNAATFLGHYKNVGLAVEVYSYQATYTDEAGDTQFYLDPDVIIMGSTAARITEHYGMIENFNHGSFVGEQFPDLVVHPKGKHADLSLESSMLIALHQPDAFVVRRVR